MTIDYSNHVDGADQPRVVAVQIDGDLVLYDPENFDTWLATSEPVAIRESDQNA